MSGPVAVVALGGTISMTGGAGVTPTLDAADLIAQVPALAGGPELRASSPMRKPGADLTFADLHAVAELVRREIAAGAAGAVVVQGTDTIEETAFALDLLTRLDEPVVVTGAMRNPTLPGADGPANVYAAVHTAASAAVRGLGVTVLLDDTIHAAVRVQKRHASMMHAFDSSPMGPLGWFQEGAPVVVDRTRVSFDPPPGDGSQVRVPLLTVTLDPDPGLVEAVLASGVDGLVVEAFGVGHVPAVLADLLVAAASAIPVVLATRTRGGSVHRRTYGFKGSERFLLDGGLVSAGWLDPIKARVLTALALSRGLGRTAVDELFDPVRPD